MMQCSWIHETAREVTGCFDSHEFITARSLQIDLVLIVTSIAAYIDNEQPLVNDIVASPNGFQSAVYVRASRVRRPTLDTPYFEW